MKKNILYIAALSFLATACNIVDINPVQGGEEQAPAANMIIETVSGTTEMATKATIANSDGAFAWTAGDNIAVHVSNGKYVFTSDTEHGASGASTNAGTASFTIAYDEGYSRDAFAVYPSTIVKTDAANYGQEDHTLDVTLPSSYTLAEVSDETSPCPMIATNTPGSGWEFKQLCGLLRLTVNSIPPTAKRLEIDFNGKKVWGEFQAQDPSETPGTPVVTPGKAIITTSDAAAYDVITITKDGDVALDGSTLNIPLPLGTYTKITVTAYDVLTGGEAIFTNTRTFDYTAKRANGTKRYAPAVFSVSGSKRVVFSQGNLQATYNSTGAGSWKWGFAAHQYDHIGNAGGNTMISTSTKEGTVPYAKLSGNGTVDLFGWSTNATYYGIAKSTTDGDYSNTFVDWGTISTFDEITYPSDYWKTMSCGNNTAPIPEWWYLMRPESGRMPAATIGGVANARFARAIINKGESPDVSVKGIIIFPDDYNGPTSNVGTDGSVIKWGLINSYSKSSSFSDGTQCTTAGWKILEEAGCVFLPISGYREGNTVNYSTSEMRYASCSERSSTHINLLSYKEGEYIYWNIDSNHKHSGVAVRLVHEIK